MFPPTRSCDQNRQMVEMNFYLDRVPLSGTSALKARLNSFSAGQQIVLIEHVTACAERLERTKGMSPEKRRAEVLSAYGAAAPKRK